MRKVRVAASTTARSSSATVLRILYVICGTASATLEGLCSPSGGEHVELQRGDHVTLMPGTTLHILPGKDAEGVEYLEFSEDHA